MKILAICPQCHTKAHVNWIGELCQKCKEGHAFDFIQKIRELGA